MTAWSPPDAWWLRRILGPHLYERVFEPAAHELLARRARAGGAWSAGLRYRANLVALIASCVGLRLANALVGARPQRGTTMPVSFTGFKLSARSLARTPGYTVAVVLMLALGIGASTAIFTVVSSVLLRPLPYPEPGRLIRLFELSDQGTRMAVPEANFRDWRESMRSVDKMARVSSYVSPTVAGSQPTWARVAHVGREFFDVMAVASFRGRTLQPDDARLGAPAVAVVGHGFWRRFGGESLERAGVRVDGTAIAVVGVMPPGFDYPDKTDIWISAEAAGAPNPSRSAHNWSVIGRLRPGASVGQAATEVGAIARRIHAQHADVTAIDAGAISLLDDLTGSSRPALLMLLAAVGVLLFIAAANGASLTLARVAARQHEVAVRAALGAGRWQLARGFLQESVLIGLAAGTLGVLLAGWGTNALLALNPGKLPRLDEVGIDWRVLAFAAGVSIVAAMGMALLPALRASPLAADNVLHGDGRTLAGGAGHTRARNVLVVAQVALTLVLMVTASLLGRSLLRLTGASLGFETGGRLTVTMSVPTVEGNAGLVELAEFHRRVHERVADLPGVTALGGVNALPLTGSGANGRFRIEGGGDSGNLWPNYRVASPGYFRAVGIPLLRGRTFDATDGRGTPQVALISQRVADAVWPGIDPIGQRIGTANMDGDETYMTIVGVVGDIRDAGAAAEARGEVYVHFLQRPGRTANFTLVLRTPGDPGKLAPAVTRIIRDENPDVPTRIETFDEVFGQSLADRRLHLGLLLGFGGAALVLAMLGVYGVLAYGVTLRTREIGLRLALGAKGSDVARLFVGDGLKLVLLGAALGLPAALAASRLLTSMLFEVTPTDAGAYLLAVVPLLVAALLACWLPARRAARLDPMRALRHE